MFYEAHTIAQCKDYVNKAKEIYINVNFGLLSHNVHISKDEAMFLLEKCSDDDTAETLELLSNSLAILYDDGTMNFLD